MRVVLVCRGGRPLDTDNLAGAFKACWDAVADWLGCDDAGSRASWRCARRPGSRPRRCVVVVRPG